MCEKINYYNIYVYGKKQHIKKIFCEFQFNY